MKKYLSVDIVTTKGWVNAYKWLFLRRVTQLTILGLFLLGPWFGVWVVKGNLASSLTLEILPLTDPYVLLQSLFTGFIPETIALIGALIVLIFYILVGGRVYCSWVCPINIITDIAVSLRERLGIKGVTQFSRTTRYWILAMSLVVSFITGTIAWEFLNPVSIIYRGLIFGMGLAWGVIVAIFIFDLFMSKRGWCTYLCPVGAFYSLLGKVSLLRISASKRKQCNDCMDCFKVCPESQVIKPALKGNMSPVILSANCTNCGQCIDVCTKDVFNFSTRFCKS
ncbi:quinol dehydrogenase ferredoxin subunit NapH [Candidatus Parabeggiatoa sp. HSG14]|uniref:quinol dehydrogenase ferredoxin subunit NapH n=1 Tax=Candidatus Parabeggiatoa sp. HSG14 TaxID=3055593 RepID=UPI0025A8BB82|nr:quinol dehydrogenase ferredoxin subunit NapH [Thiotrichales bacterium HSG14]